MDPLVFGGERVPPPQPSESATSDMDATPSKPRSVEELFEREESALLHFAMGMVGRRSVAEDLVQEVFFRLLPLWDEVGNPRAWLYRSLRNLALNHLRDRRDDAAVSDSAPLDDAPDPESEWAADRMGRAEAVGTVRLLLAELTAADRRLVELKYEAGLRYDEISRRTGLTVGNVGYRLHHVLKSLGDALRRAGIEGSQG